ncbi:MAG: ectoine hydroxylase-related dioxygenase (phytanoyl-CoA dioxygenase family) [Gammaproteobacteria bacterium]|jgi:ectoine hydroxylase-related dioxygenase (phytanoyl-CoA dioxygenase family)
MASNAYRNLTTQEIDEYQAEGVVLVKQCVDPIWIERMTKAIDDQLARPSQWGEDTNPGSKRARFLHDRYLWPTKPAFNDYVFNSGVAEIAGQVMKSKTSRIYFDHVFVKEPATEEEFFWHQDLPYWPFKGTQICSIWLSLSDVDIHSSGLEFVRGSHRWNKWFKPVLPGGVEGELAKWIGQSDEEDIPDFNSERDGYEFTSFETKAGDALIFNTSIVHTSHGNQSPIQRRLALSTRWLGDDACWDPRPGTDPIVTQETVNLEPGAYASDDRAFPLVWQAA